MSIVEQAFDKIQYTFMKKQKKPKNRKKKIS